MPTAAQDLAQFAAQLKYSAIPPAVAARAKECIIDTIAAAAFGVQMPWGQFAIDYARRYGSGGACSIVGVADARVHAPYAALVNGVLAHAFELDCTRDPAVGAHPGAALVPALLAASEEARADGKAAITALVAACEILCRVAGAAHHSKMPLEKLGFHAPGSTGTYGAAIAAGCVFGLSAEQLTNSLGIAGSLSAGLLAFTKSQQGGMVKRLHIGRAAESGVLAARLAGSGYTGPETVLEGKFGFLEVYCREGDPQRLTGGLGTNWETLRINMKRYACHMQAHTPVQSARELMAEHGFKGEDVQSMVVEGAEKLTTHHNILEPNDIMQMQYSVPFCVALSLFRNPDDPKSFDAAALTDTAIRTLCRRVEIKLLGDGQGPGKSTRLTVRLKDGREFIRTKDKFTGMPDAPFTRDELRSKFLLLTSAMGETAAAQLFERLDRLETEPIFTVTQA